MRIRAAFLLAAGLCWAQAPVQLPRAVLDVKVEPGLVFTVESSGTDSDRIAVRDESGKLLLGPLVPAPLDPKPRHTVVGDVARWGAGRIAVSVLLKLKMSETRYGVVLLDLHNPKQPAEFHDLGGYWCESLAPGPDETLWCAGAQVKKATELEKDYHLLRRYDRDFRVVQEEFPRNRFEGVRPAGRLMPGPGGSAVLWIPAYRVFCDTGAAGPASCRSDLPVTTAGRPMPSVALAPTGSLLALLPNRNGNETLSTPYALFSTGPGRAWAKVDGSPEVPRGVQMAGYGERGVALWNRTSRTLSFLEWPLKRVAANEE